MNLIKLWYGAFTVVILITCLYGWKADRDIFTAYDLKQPNFDLALMMTTVSCLILLWTDWLKAYAFNVPIGNHQIWHVSIIGLLTGLSGLSYCFLLCTSELRARRTLKKYNPKYLERLDKQEKDRHRLNRADKKQTSR